jgi:hypothetical protein
MTEKKSSWREPMLWLVFGLPLASIVAGVGLVIVASRSGSSDSLTDNVQRVAQIQTTDLGPDREAETRKLSAIVRIEEGTLEVIPVTGEFDRTAPLRLTLLHPVQKQGDRVLELLPSARGWALQQPLDDSHDWKLQLQPADARWRLKGRLPRQQHAARLAPSVSTD